MAKLKNDFILALALACDFDPIEKFFEFKKEIHALKSKAFNSFKISMLILFFS